MMAKKSAWVLALFILSACAHHLPTRQASRPFDSKKDSFAFANETVWHYEDGKPSARQDSGKEKPYTRRCFVVCRAAVQFWKFARFDSTAKPLPAVDLAKRIREVTSRDVWQRPLPMRERVVFPGYQNLREASAAHPRVFQENIGLGWPVYFRPGNFTVVFPPSRAHQARTHEELQESLELGHPTILWLINFPSLSINHAVVVYGQRRKKGKFFYLVYDPNSPGVLRTLEYRPKERSFYFEKTFYFKGGLVSVRPIYLSLLQ
ncbi:MAG: hypothetical protein V1746_07105 [bacterium]